MSNKELLNYVIDSLGSKFDPAVVHISSKLDSSIENMTPVEAKFLLQKYGRIYRNSCYPINMLDSSVNMATKFVDKESTSSNVKEDSGVHNMSLFYANGSSVRANSRGVNGENL